MHHKELEILYEDNHLLAVFKPAGIIVHGDKTGDRSLRDVVEDYIRVKYKKPGNVFVGLTHRLDRPVSGVCLFAKTGKALARINRMFQDKEIKKTYLSLSKNKPEPLEGRLEHFLLKNKERNKVSLYDTQKKDAKKSILEYKLVSVVNGISMLEINPITGRSHQIRVQLAKIDCAVLGDVKYGHYMKPLEDKNIALHCFRMAFTHPVKKEPLTIEAMVPRRPIWNFFREVELS